MTRYQPQYLTTPLIPPNTDVNSRLHLVEKPTPTPTVQAMRYPPKLELIWLPRVVSPPEGARTPIRRHPWTTNRASALSALVSVTRRGSDQHCVNTSLGLLVCAPTGASTALLFGPEFDVRVVAVLARISPFVQNGIPAGTPNRSTAAERGLRPYAHV